MTKEHHRTDLLNPQSLWPDTDGLLWLFWSLGEQIWPGAAATDGRSGWRERQPPALRQRHASRPRSRHQECLRVSQGQSTGTRSKASGLQSAHPACQHSSQSEEPRRCRYENKKKTPVPFIPEGGGILCVWFLFSNLKHGHRISLSAVMGQTPPSFQLAWDEGSSLKCLSWD